MKKPSESGLTFIFWGLVFFLTPCFAVIDILPDFIGCLLIRAGLTRIFAADQQLRTARRDTRRLFVVGILKTASVAIFALFPGDPTLITLITFVFGVLELVFGLPLVNSLFDGLSAASVRCEGGAALDSLESVRLILKIFLWTRCVCSFLPECFVLFDPAYTGELVHGSVRLSETLNSLKLVTRFLQLALVGVFGLFVFFRLRRFFYSLRSDGEFVSSFDSRLAEKIGDFGNFENRLYLNRALALLLGASVFTFRFYASFFGVIPDFVVFLLLIFADRSLRNAGLENAGRRAPFGVLAVVSGVCWLFRCVMSVRYFLGFEEAWQSNAAVYPLGLLSALCLGTAFFAVADRLDACSEKIYGRRRIRTGILKTLGVAAAAAGFIEYSFPSLYRFSRLMFDDRSVGRTLDDVNTIFAAAAVIITFIYVFRVWLASSAMREEIDFD